MAKSKKTNQKSRKQKSKSAGPQILIVAIVILALILVYRFVIQGGDKAVNLANQGVELLKLEKFSEAEEKLVAARGSDPSISFANLTDDPALANIGIANGALENGDYATAARFYARAYQIDSTAQFEKYARFAHDFSHYPEGVYIELGNMFWSSALLDLAKLSYERALDINPNSISALSNLGNIARRQDNSEEATRHYNRALAVDPTAFEPRVNMVSMSYIDQQWSAFNFQLEKLREYHPEAAFTYFFTAQDLQRKDNCEEAIPLFEKYLADRPNDLDGRLSLVDCMIKEGQFANAQGLIMDLVTEYQGDRRIYARGIRAAEGALKAEEFDLAKNYYENLMLYWPEDPELEFGLASSLLRLEQHEEARTYFEDLLHKYPESSTVLTNLGIVYANMGKPEWAKEQLEAAIAIDSSAIAYFNLGRIFEAEGDTAMANSCYMTAAIREPEMFGVYDMMMEQKLEKSERISEGDTTGMIFKGLDE